MNKFITVFFATVALCSVCDALLVGGKFANANAAAKKFSNNAALKASNAVGLNNAVAAKKAFGAKKNIAAANKAAAFANKFDSTKLALHNNVLKDNQLAVKIVARNKFAKSNALKFAKTHKKAIGAKKANKIAANAAAFNNAAVAAKKNAFAKKNIAALKKNNAYANAANKNFFNGLGGFGYGGYGPGGGVGYGGFGKGFGFGGPGFGKGFGFGGPGFGKGFGFGGPGFGKGFGFGGPGFGKGFGHGKGFFY